MRRTFITNNYDLQNWFLPKDVTVCAFDTETICENDTDRGALDYSQLHWIGASFCNGTDACYIDLDVPDRDKMLETLALAFGKIKKLIGHNIQFDMMVLYKYGIEHTETIFCTMVAAHLIDENQQKGLKDLSYKYLPGSYNKIIRYKDVKDKGHHSYEFYDYGLDDSVNTWGLYEKFFPELRRDKLTYLFFKIEMPFQFCLRDLHINGVLVDRDKIQSIEDQMQPLMDAAEDKMLEMLDRKAFIEKAFWQDLDTRSVAINFNSNKQVIPLLIEKFGIKFTELTTTGEQRRKDKKEVGDDYYKLDKIVLGGTKLDDGEIGGLAKDYPFCHELLIFKMAKDLRDKFTKKMKESISPDGRIRCSFNDTVAATGRLSSSEPNLQNLRKLNAILGVECRSCFIAPDGKSLLVADFSGQELRVLYKVTQDSVLKEAFDKGFDLHLSTANLVFDLGLTERECINKTPEHEAAAKKYKVERHKAKNGLVFPVVYGSTAIGISRNIGVSVDEAQELLDKFLDSYPGIRDGIDLCKEEIKLYGYVRNAAGRCRRFPDGFTNRALRQAFNFKVQSYSAEMLRIAMVAIRQLILAHPDWEMLMVLTIHDEVVLEIKDEYIDEASVAVNKAMCEAVDLGIPVLCDIGVGRNYSDAK